MAHSPPHCPRNCAARSGALSLTPIPRNAGFKLDTLLRLADVKGTDRRTSLLAFVTAALLARGQGDVGSLPAQLSSIRPAANLQVPAAAHRHVKPGVHRVVATVGQRFWHHLFTGVHGHLQRSAACACSSMQACWAGLFGVNGP